MRVKVLIPFFLVLNYYAGSAQIFSERQASHHLDKAKWDRAYTLINKMRHKDTTNAVAEFLMARYYFDSRCPLFHIDSANKYLKNANRIFQNAPQKARDRWSRFAVDSLVLLHSRTKLDSMAFARTVKVNTVEGYTFFLKEFPSALQQDEATQLLHEVAFQDAKKLNTYQAFFEYIQTYPLAKQFNEAKDQYESLLYETKTKDKRLHSYQEFLKAHGDSPHRSKAEFQIMERVTANGSPESFEIFVKGYPQSKAAKRANAIWFHLLTNDEQLHRVDELTDSLKHVVSSQPDYMVPVVHQQETLFLNGDGEQLFSVPANDFPKDYWCGDLQEDLIMLPDKVINVVGSVVYEGNVIGIDDIGKGYVLLDVGDCNKLIHKSGFVIDADCIEDARIICSSFIALKKQGKWSIWSLAGVQLQSYQWDDVLSFDEVVVLQQHDKFKLVTKANMAAIADQQPLHRMDAYDQVKLWKRRLIWAKSSVFEGVLDQHLSIYIHFEKHELAQTNLGITALQDSRTTVYVDNKPLGTYRQVIERAPWMAGKQTHWQLFKPGEQFVSQSYDSISFAGPFALGYYADSLDVYGMKGTQMALKAVTRVEFIAGQDSAFFLLVEFDQKKILFTPTLEKLITVPFDQIQYAGEKLFIVSKKEKKGLLNTEGKLVLPVEYDAIGTVKDGLVSVLRAMKFGLVDIRKNLIIKPEYNKNPWVYPSQGVVVFKQNKYNFVDWKNKSKSDFVFDDVKYWNDSVALVKKDNQWLLYEVATKKVVLENISDYSLINSAADDQLMIVRQEGSYGVLHNKRGVLIPISFSDIVNLGSKSKPFYFTEKHVEEASIFVVIYYNYAGKMIRKEVYEPAVYEEIYCND